MDTHSEVPYKCCVCVRLIDQMVSLTHLEPDTKAESVQLSVHLDVQIRWTLTAESFTSTEYSHCKCPYCLDLFATQIYKSVQVSISENVQVDKVMLEQAQQA